MFFSWAHCSQMCISVFLPSRSSVKWIFASRFPQYWQVKVSRR